MPAAGVFLGLAIFAAIGITLCVAFEQTELKQALIVGIAAPGIITNIVAGAQVDSRSQMIAGLFTSALAQEKQIEWKEPTAIDPPIILDRNPSPGKVALKTVSVTLDARGIKGYEEYQKAFVTVKYSIEGNFVSAGSIRPGQTRQLIIPKNAEELIAQFHGKVSSVDLPLANANVIITLSGLPSWRNDLEWALGRTRSLGASKLTMQVR